MQGSIDGIRICGIASTVPKHIVSNAQYVESMSKRAKKQVELTGIEERRVCINGQKSSDLAAVAGEELLKRLNWDPNTIKVLIFVTQSADFNRPGSSYLIQNRLGIGKDCLVYDINQGCTGFTIGLTTICSLLKSSGGRGLLLVGESNSVEGENLSRHDLLSGDGGGAAALECCEGCPPIVFKHCGDGSRADLLFVRHDGTGFMDGNAILLFAISDVAEDLKCFMSDYNLNMDNVDYFVFHQAQKMIVDGIVKMMNIPEEKVLMSCREFGNTSSASIPITISKEFADGQVAGKAKMILCGFGIGLSWGISYVDIDSRDVMPLIETEYVYDDRRSFIERLEGGE